MVIESALLRREWLARRSAFLSDLFEEPTKVCLKKLRGGLAQKKRRARKERKEKERKEKERKERKEAEISKMKQEEQQEQEELMILLRRNRLILLRRNRMMWELKNFFEKPHSSVPQAENLV